MLIQQLDGSVVDMDDYGVHRLFHRISSIEVEDGAEILSGRDGDIPTPDFRYASRSISVDFVFQVRDIQDFYLMRDQVNNILTSRRDFYIIFKREPYIRWRVRRLAAFTIEPNPKGGTFTVEFKCAKVRGESRYRTSQLQSLDGGKTWDKDMFAWNDTISWDDTFDYDINTGSNITVYNHGTSTVNPRYDDLKIDIIPGPNLTNGFTLHNEHNGDTFIMKGPLNSDDNITIDGVRIWLNGRSAFEKTGHTLLSLEPGPNSIRVFPNGSGVVNIAKLSFDFRFMYE